MSNEKLECVEDVEELSPEQARQRARDEYGSDDVEIDSWTPASKGKDEDDFSQADDGCWVRGWLWLPNVRVVFPPEPAAPPPKPKRAKPLRWPDDTPQEVIDLCKAYWHGTTEFSTFRIHCWNDHAVWTSYPAGGYSDNGGWHYCSPHYYLLSRTEQDRFKPKRLRDMESTRDKPVTKRMMQLALDELASPPVKA